MIVSNYSELNHSVGLVTLPPGASREESFQLFRIKPFGWGYTITKIVL